MGLPLFPPGDDPGPNFAALIRHSDHYQPRAASLDANGGALPAVTHGTTVVALRFADGVVMAGDRRATEGNIIAHRAMEKVFPADRHSAVAIAGAAGPAVEMVKLFQTQLEHYEKVEGVALSLEGKANQLGQMVREHLPMAMQGLVVVPLFCGFDLRLGEGRIFTYDVTGGHFEEADFGGHGIGGPRRPDHHQARLARRSRTSRQHRAGRAGPVRGGRRGFRHGRARSRAGDLPRCGHRHEPGI